MGAERSVRGAVKRQILGCRPRALEGLTVALIAEQRTLGGGPALGLRKDHGSVLGRQHGAAELRRRRRLVHQPRESRCQRSVRDPRPKQQVNASANHHAHSNGGDNAFAHSRQDDSLVAEISFVTNKQEAALLKRSAYRQQIAESLLEGILRYQASLKGVRAIAARE